MPTIQVEVITAGGGRWCAGRTSTRRLPSAKVPLAAETDVLAFSGVRRPCNAPISRLLYRERLTERELHPHSRTGHLRPRVFPLREPGIRGGLGD